MNKVTKLNDIKKRGRGWEQLATFADWLPKSFHQKCKMMTDNDGDHNA